jgi:hypothetical protein
MSAFEGQTVCGKSAFAVAIGGKGDMPFCSAGVVSRLPLTPVFYFKRVCLIGKCFLRITISSEPVGIRWQMPTQHPDQQNTIE